MNKYKTFIPRLGAVLLDTILLLPLAILADSLSEGSYSEGQRLAFFTTLNLLNIIYFVVLHGLYGQTAGKYLMKVKVVNKDEGKIGFRQAIIRNGPQFVLVAAGIIPAFNIELGGSPEAPLTPLSMLMALWVFADVFVFLIDPKRRALHDRIAGTVVVRIEEGPGRED